MTDYPYIQDLFKGILTQSKAIKGRFYIGHRYGLQEINSDLLGEVLKQFSGADKYPLVLMAPPHSRGLVTIDGADWERYRIILFFMKTTYYGVGNQVNPNTATSITTVLSDWHDMKRCAINFVRALCTVQRSNKQTLHRVPGNQVLYVPLSAIGADNASGVKVDFDIDIWPGCTVEDYSEYPTTLTLAADSMPERTISR